MLDSEWMMEILCCRGLDQNILGSISELRKKATGDAETRATACSKLEQILLNTADLFEWEFFAEHQYEAFADELLSILAHCDGSHGNLHTEAAGALMSMCSTNIQGVCSFLVNNSNSRKLLQNLAHDIAQAKSFHYEALFLEIVYRVQRHLSKSEDPATKQLASTIVASFPDTISKAFAQITPKNFRESTRQLLNDFNLAVGVIESFKISNLECVMPKNRKINVGEVIWIDAGENVLEAEVTWKKEAEKFESILKLPFSSIRKVELEATKCAVSLRVNPKTRLVDLLEGINDRAWAEIAGFHLTIHSDPETIARLLASIQRKSSSEPLNNAKAAVVSNKPAADTSVRKPTASQTQAASVDCSTTMEVNSKSPAKTNQDAKKLKNPSGRRQKPESTQKVSSKAFEFALGQIDSSGSIKLKQKVPVLERSNSGTRENSEKLPVKSKLVGTSDKLKKQPAKIRQEGGTDKLENAPMKPRLDDVTAKSKKAPVKSRQNSAVEQPTKKELAFAENIDKSHPTNFAKRKQSPTPFASGSSASPADLTADGKKRDAEHMGIGTSWLGEVAVIPNSPQYDQIKRPKVATQASKKQEQKTSALLTTSARVDEAQPRMTEIRKTVNFLDPGKANNESMCPEGRHSVFSLPQQPSQTSSDTSSVECLSPGYTLKPHHSRQTNTTVGAKYHQDYASPNVIESANEGDTAQSQQSLGASQQAQYQALQRLIEDILGVQESYRAHLLSSTCGTLQTQMEKDLLKKSALLHDQQFLPSDNECTRVKASVTDHHEQIAAFQQTMNELIAQCNTLGKRIQNEASSIQEHIRESAKNEWRHILDGTIKKARSQHGKRVSQAKDKMRSIESSYDTDGLMVMQQMLHRI